MSHSLTHSTGKKGARGNSGNHYENKEFQLLRLDASDTILKETDTP